ncbi:MAG TPA: S-layer homology domain-containing protein [Thermoanaerobacterales bacterium]|nr:S-layer homology domain-containing protein [Thermoanaerobacterales bacterium]
MIIVKAYSYATGKKMSDIYTTSEVKFMDEGAVKSWARSYVRLADALGLMNGNPDGTFAPGDGATRAQAAVIIRRLLEKSGKL